MIGLLLALALGQDCAPKQKGLSDCILYKQQDAGDVWCGAACYFGTKSDGGAYSRPLYDTAPTREACRAKLVKTCERTKQAGGRRP